MVGGGKLGEGGWDRGTWDGVVGFRVGRVMVLVLSAPPLSLSSVLQRRQRRETAQTTHDASAVAHQPLVVFRASKHDEHEHHEHFFSFLKPPLGSLLVPQK